MIKAIYIVLYTMSILTGAFACSCGCCNKEAASVEKFDETDDTAWTPTSPPQEDNYNPTYSQPPPEPITPPMYYPPAPPPCFVPLVPCASLKPPVPTINNKKASILQYKLQELKRKLFTGYRCVCGVPLPPQHPLAYLRNKFVSNPSYGCYYRY